MMNRRKFIGLMISHFQWGQKTVVVKRLECRMSWKMDGKSGEWTPDTEMIAIWTKFRIYSCS